MTAWLISFGWNWLLVPVVSWFAIGLRRALVNPRLKYRSHTKTKGGLLLSVYRQELLPPWRTLEETWFVTHPIAGGRHSCVAYCEGSGDTIASDDFFTSLHGKIHGAAVVAIARDAETEELSK